MLKYFKNKSRKAKPSADELRVKEIHQSGIFDAEWYVQTYQDVRESGTDPLIHFYYTGWREGRKPCRLFDTEWYRSRYEDVAQADMNALVHYIRFGEKEGRLPSPYFDPSFYRTQVAEGEVQGTLLGHYIKGGFATLSPNPYFDTAFYLETNPDIAKAKAMPLLHYIDSGWRELREIHRTYSFAMYGKVIADRTGTPVEPLLYYMTEGAVHKHTLPQIGAAAPAGGSTQSLQLEIAKNMQPGPHFEAELTGCADTVDCVRARMFAFYLPQFHPFAENDKWWGKGFTEWRNVTRALPRFEGHEQPRMPRDLGFYDLRNVDTIREQVRMAKQSGVTGFCFYYYWFNRTRLLDRPLDLFLANGDIDFPFSIMWANENWTRRWDGLENDVLMKQEYKPEDDAALVADLARYFKDPRYERIDGRPLFIIYRPGIVPNFSERLAAWRTLFEQEHGLNPLIFMVLGFGDNDPGVYGLDGGIEFPPHKIAQGLPPVNARLKMLDPAFEGHYMSYDDLITSSLAVEPPEFELIRTLVPAWDNEARKPSRGMGFVGANPEKYEFWLNKLVEQAVSRPLFGKQPYVFVNAWNEWAEGAHLEPDLHNGVAYLNATFRALTGIRRPGRTSNDLLLVGHDAYLHGAQLLTLNIMRTLVQRFGMNVTLLLLDGGPLVKDYRELGNVIVASETGRPLAEVVNELAGSIPAKQAICNTVVVGEVVELLASSGFKVVSLVHELSQLITERQLEPRAEAIAAHAEQVIFAAEFVKESFEKITGAIGSRAMIRPQGIYQSVQHEPALKSKLRERLGLPANAKVVINLGYGDLRKGFDLFVSAAKKVIQRSPECHFVWLGNVHGELKHWFDIDLARAPLTGHFHLLPFDHDVNMYLNGADVFALTSREDPFPSVVLEALACGLPVVAFEGGGGYVEAIMAHEANGAVVGMGDVGAMALAIEQQLLREDGVAAAARAARAVSRYNWADYVFGLLQGLMPELKKISVVVPNYNYAKYLPQRLGSILAQDYPIYELIVLDDRSPDNSVEVLHSFLASARRMANVIVNETNSGSVFKQWEKGTQLARGDYVWIAEADDGCTSSFLADMVARFTSSTTIGFCDSSQVDSEGKVTANSYGYYYHDLRPNPMASSFTMDGKDFVQSVLSVKNVIMNVSSTLIDREALAGVFERERENILSYKVAGDWYIYVCLLSEAGAEICYTHKSNNVHRRHAVSVTHELDKRRHFEEIEKVQRFAAEKLHGSREVSQLAKDYLGRVSIHLGVSREMAE